MRIGMFADMYKPHISGVTNCISMYKQQFEKLGHEVIIFTYGDTSYADDEPNVVRSPAVAWGDTGWQMGVGLSREAKRLLPTVDVAHVHHPFLSGSVALRSYARTSVPVLFTNHTRYDLYSDAYARFVPRGIRMAFLKRYLRSFAQKIDLVIAPSQGILEWLREFEITCRATLHPNAIDTSPFTNPTNPRSRSEFGWAPDSVVFCYLGRIGPEKNPGMLIEAFSELAAIEPRAHLLLIGDGPERVGAQERVRARGLTQRVHFVGRTPYTMVPDLLAAADVFVTTSVSEAHPLVVIEAMAAGLPAIGVRSPGVGDIVEDGVTGFLTAESVPEFAARMALLARDSNMRKSMAKAALRAARRYDIQPMAHRMLQHYERLIAAKSSLAKIG